MRRRIVSAVLTVALILGVSLVMGQTGSQAILGKWLAKAETPNGPMDLEFEFKLEGSQLTGTASVMGNVVPMANVKFDGSKLTGEIIAGADTYQIAANLSEGKLSGNWQQSGSETKGTWSAERAAPAPAAAGGGGVAGSWDTVAVTPGGDLRAVLDVKQEAAGLAGVLNSEMGTIAVSAVTFKDGKLHFEIDIGGTLYAVDADLQGDALKGKWSPVGGGEGGDWSGTRKAAGPPPAAVPAPESLAGDWEATAESPDGNLAFQMQLKQSGESVSGQLVAPDGSIALQKPAYAAGKLSFEVEYMGGTYRIELTLEGGKLTGKWAAVSGTESGKFYAQRKAP